MYLHAQHSAHAEFLPPTAPTATRAEPSSGLPAGLGSLAASADSSPGVPTGGAVKASFKETVDRIVCMHEQILDDNNMRKRTTNHQYIEYIYMYTYIIYTYTYE